MTKAFVFPGQGSQAVGMGKELAGAFAPAREVFEEVDEAVVEVPHVRGGKRLSHKARKARAREYLVSGPGGAERRGRAVRSRPKSGELSSFNVPFKIPS